MSLLHNPLLAPGAFFQNLTPAPNAEQAFSCELSDGTSIVVRTTEVPFSQVDLVEVVQAYQDGGRTTFRAFAPRGKVRAEWDELEVFVATETALHSINGSLIIKNP